MKPQANHRVFQTQQQQQTQNRTKGAWVGIVESQNTRPGGRADKARTLAHLDCCVPSRASCAGGTHRGGGGVGFLPHFSLDLFFHLRADGLSSWRIPRIQNTEERREIRTEKALFDWQRQDLASRLLEGSCSVCWLFLSWHGFCRPFRNPGSSLVAPLIGSASLWSATPAQILPVTA